MNNGYNEELTIGAEKIISRAKELADKDGIMINECIWDDGKEMDYRDKHKLEIFADGMSITAEFSDEKLEDYPGKAGTEQTEAIICAMIKRLKEAINNDN